MSIRVTSIENYRPPPQINRTVEELVYDLNHESDPLKRFMIRNFLRIRSQQESMIQRAHQMRKTETDSIESLSEEDKYDLDSEDSEIKERETHSDSRNNKKKTKKIEELEELERIKKSSMRELKKKRIDKLREEAYREMIDGEETDSDNDEISYRGDHQRWRSEDLNDPKYARYAKEDKLNNRMMERLNSEIDFMQDDRRHGQIVKPFDDGMGIDNNYEDDYASARHDRPRRDRRRRR